MRFTQLDKIIECEPGSHLRAIKCLSLAEEYLQDHFPRFPVMPGVLMLEAMYQASMLLWHRTDDFRFGMVVLRESRNVKFQDFVQPGKQLTIESTIQKIEADTATFKTEGMLDNHKAVSARLVLERYNLADRGGATSNDQLNRTYFSEWFDKLYQVQSDSISTEALPARVE